MADAVVVHKAEKNALGMPNHGEAIICKCPTSLRRRHRSHAGVQFDGRRPRRALGPHSTPHGNLEGLGWWKAQRTQQRLDAMHRRARQLLIESHMHHKSEAWKRLEKEVLQGETGPFASARSWVHLPLNS